MPQSVSFNRGQISLTYDSTSGVLQSVTSPEGNTLSYTYDGSLPLTETWTGEVSGTVGVKYDSDFKIVKQYINGADSIDFRYDKDNNIIGVGALRLKRDPSNGLIKADTLGNITDSMSYTTLGELSRNIWHQY
jgi:YD repeat-containing protein